LSDQGQRTRSLSGSGDGDARDKQENRRKPLKHPAMLALNF
jgi:hypothetical protein